jgi:alpha-galactosidase
MRARRQERRQAQLEEQAKVPVERSNEYSVNIMNAMETNVPYLFNGNVRNTGLITNLPPDCAVEVPCVADATGIHPCYIGELAPELAALNHSNVAVHQLAVAGLLTHDRELIYRAVKLDPLTMATTSLEQAQAMVDELFQAHAALLTI